MIRRNIGEWVKLNFRHKRHKERINANLERSVGKGKILEAARERAGSGKIGSSGRGPEDLGVGSHFFGR